MAFHQRSTNERALARRRFKHAVDIRAVDIRAVDIRAVEEDATSVLVASSLASNPVVISTATSLTPQSNPLPTTSSSSILKPVTVSQPTTTSLTSTLSLLTPMSLVPSTSVQVASSPSRTPTTSHPISSGMPAQTDAVNSGTSTKSQGLSPGAVGGIVAVIVILALVVFGFFMRRRAQHRRAAKRNTWGVGLIPALANKRTTVYAGPPFANQFMTASGGVPGSHDNIPKTSEISQTFPGPSIPGLTTPASSFNPVSPIVPSSARGAPSLRSVAPSSRSGPPAIAELAIVARTFITSLPDEMVIANGEQIRILNAFDDGWAFCSNTRGDQGFVPLECLQRSLSVPVDMQLQPQSQIGGFESNRTSRRLSSLAPHMAGTY